MEITLRDYQIDAKEGVRAAYRDGYKSVILVLATGAGKCLGRDTPVLMFDGTIKLVQDVVIGDLLMGPDGQPRRVESLARGQERMFKIGQIGTHCKPYIVNESHILSLIDMHAHYRSGRAGSVTNISVKQYLKKPKHWRERHNGWSVPNVLRGDSRTVHLTRITVTPVGVGDYYGFEISGPDRLFLLGDFTVTHNTVIFSSIAKSAEAKGKRVMVIAHRDQLIKQASRKLRENGVNHGIIMAGFTPNPIARTQVASVQTLTRRMNKMRFQPDLIIIDECLRGDSMIETDKGMIQIKDVLTSGAKMVWTFDGKQRCWRKIVGFADQGERKTVKVSHKYGFIVCTGNHPFYTADGWKCAEWLDTTDLLLTAGGDDWSPVLSVVEHAPCNVYDIQVEDTECFYANGVLVHNCHLSAAPSYVKVVEHYRKLNPKTLLLGVTGSPCRLDNKPLGSEYGGLYDTMVTGISIGQLIERGFLVKPIVYGSNEPPDLSSVKKKGGDFDEDEMAGIINKPAITGNAIEHYQRICNGIPAVAWCCNIRHATDVCAEFNAAGIAAAVLTGESSGDERDRVLKQLDAGEIKVVTFVGLLIEGVDCPAIGAIIILRHTLSLSNYLQAVGRGLRPYEYSWGKKLVCYVLDHVNIWKVHGFADEERDWSLDWDPKPKKKKADDEGETIQAEQCRQCDRIFTHVDGREHAEALRLKGHEIKPDAMHCPHCDGEFIRTVRSQVIEQKDGVLSIITPEMRKAAQVERKKSISKAKTLEELQRIGAEAGYHAGWAAHVFNARQNRRF